MAIVILYIAATLDIHIKNHVLTSVQLTAHLTLESAIEAVGIYLLILQKLIIVYSESEFLRGEKEILYSVLLGATRLATGA